MIKLVIDMMGGDNGYKPTVAAVSKFLEDFPDAEIVAVGNENVLTPLQGKDRVKIIPSSTIVPMECGVLEAMRSKDSSVYKAVNAVIDEEADAIVSAGSTGAFLSLVTLIIKKIDGVKRPAIISPFPTRLKDKQVVLLDVGANAENSADDLVNFAAMGVAYYKVVFGKEEPDIHLICNGTEEGKGTPLYKETYELLKPNPHFKGYIEGRNVLSGEADVVVFDGFTGNIFLKTTEGTAKLMSGMIREAFTSSLRSKIGYLFAKKGFNQLKDKMDYKKVGGGFLIGVNTVAVKAHGNANEVSFYSSMRMAYNLAKNGIIEKIKENLKA